MRLTFTRIPTLAFAILLTTIACSGGTPMAPESSTAVVSGTAAAADGSTLKATAPTPLSPLNEERISSLRPTLQVAGALGRFVSPPQQPFSYEFELQTSSGSGVRSETVAGTSWTLPVDLEHATDYRWRARAVFDGAVGPWSGMRAFRTPIPVPGCVNGRLEDPKAYFFHLIGRNEGDPARDWESVLVASGLPAGPVAGQRIPDSAPFYGLTQQIDSSGNLRGRVFLPTNEPDFFGYYIHHIEILSDPSGGRWIWQPIGTAGAPTGAPPYAPRACP